MKIKNYKFKMHVSGLFLIPLLLLAGCTEKSAAPPHMEEKIEVSKLRKVIGQEIFDVIRLSTDATVSFSVNSTSTSISLYPVQLQQLKEQLLNDQGYLFQVSKKVIFIPTTTFWFIYGQQMALIQVSIPSSQIMFSMGNQKVILDDDPMHSKIVSFIAHLKEGAQP